jgi:hypothetical protein
MTSELHLVVPPWPLPVRLFLPRCSITERIGSCVIAKLELWYSRGDLGSLLPFISEVWYY